MPTGVYVRTENYKKEVSERNKKLGIKPPYPFWKDKKFSDKHRENIGEAKKKSENIFLRPEIKERIRKASVGNKYALGNKYNLGRKQSPETIEKIRQWHIGNPNRKFKNTSIELKVEAELIKRGINYQKQVPLCKIAVVDFYLPEYRIVIQADGDYWHKYPFGKERDKKQDAVLTFNGFNVYRFWECEINKSVENCINRIFNLKSL